MVSSHPFLLQSVKDGSFLCVACGETIYNLRHTCEEQVELMAQDARRLSEKVHENN